MTFLGKADVEQRLDELSALKELTVFVGAGSSMEVALPSWNQLLDRLLDHAMDLGKLDEANAQLVKSAAWSDGMGVLGMGSLVRAMLGANPDSFIRDALYAVAPSSAKIATQDPGPTARAAARLLPLWPRGSVEIVTTNYDLLLEQALKDVFTERAAASLPSFAPDDAAQSGIRDVQPGVDQPLIDSGVLVVRHLHGALARKANKLDILPAVIAEHDYYDVQAGNSWQSTWFTQRLRQAPCLLVGASMTDANILKFLHLAGNTSTARHTALVYRADSAPPTGTPAHDLWTTATTARWDQYRVDALYPEFFSDTAAFLEELARRRERRLAKKRMAATDRRQARLERWRSAISKSVLPMSGARFAEAQEKVTDALAKQLKIAIDVIAGRPKVADCRYGLQLWIPDEAGTTLVQWGSSQHAWRDPATLEPLPIALPTKWLPIETWCQGTPTLKTFSSEHGTRWKEALGVPITLQEEPWGRLTVAVITLNVMGEHADGLLQSLPADELSDVVALLQEAFTELLTPDA